jgi:hypothetical protein
MAANSGQMPLRSSNIAADAGVTARSVTAKTEALQPVELAANTGLQMIRQYTAIAGLELFQPLPPVAA